MLEERLRSYWLWLVIVPAMAIFGISLMGLSLGRPLGSILSGLLFAILMPWTWFYGLYLEVDRDFRLIPRVVFLCSAIYFLINLKKQPRVSLYILSAFILLSMLSLIRGCGSTVGKTW